MSEADLIIVADTGSTDQTLSKLKSRNVSVYEIKVNPWRFDQARNLCLDLIPDDIDICVSTDLDEVFDPGWREKLENSWHPEATRLRYTYTFGFYEDGTPIVTFPYEQIHRKRDFRWLYPVHEVLDYTGTDPDIYAVAMDIHLKHYPDNTKTRTQYLPLLEISAKDFPLYDRNIHYLGREYMFHGRYDEAIETLTYHLTLPTALWKDERCASMRYIARCYKLKNNLQEATTWLYRAIAEAPHLREPYIEMASLAYEQHDWIKMYHMVDSALKITSRSGSYLDEETSWGYVLYDFGAISCYWLGLYEKALSFSQSALAKSPDDKRLQNNLTIIQEQFDKQLH